MLDDHAIADERADQAQNSSSDTGTEDHLEGVGAVLLDPAAAHGGVEGVGQEAQQGSDTDHGANILQTLQLMVLQIDGCEIHLLPAFPKEWNVSFRLWVDKDTVVEGRYRNKNWEKLTVSNDRYRIVK